MSIMKDFEKDFDALMSDFKEVLHYYRYCPYCKYKKYKYSRDVCVYTRKTHLNGCEKCFVWKGRE